MLAESNRPSVSTQQSAAPQSFSADSLYRSNATATDRLLQVFQRRKWAIATAAFAAASGVWVWTLTRPSIYEGQVQISVDRSTPTRDQAAGVEPNLLQSPTVLESTASALAQTYPNLSYQVISENVAIAAQDGRSLAVDYQGNSPSEVEAVLEELSQQYQEVSETPVVISPPTVGDRPISPKVLKGLLLGVVAGLAAGAMAALLAEKLDRSFHSPDSLKSFSNLPMLGIVPFSKTLQPTKPGQITPPIAPALPGVADYETASFLESFRTLYSNLRFLKPDQAVRSLVISSAIPAEGKSTTALNLAKAAAVMGQRVLLVDADLRLPQIHTRLKLPNTKGLSEILSQNVSWQDHLQSALDDNLQILTAGSAPLDPVRLLSSPAMEALTHELSNAFDLVIYDMPPLLGFTDSGLVAMHTDGIVMVVGLGTTTRVELKQALDRLEVMPVRVLGMVANGIRSHTTQSYSYDRYHRYYAQRAMVTAAEFPSVEEPETLTPTAATVDNQEAIALETAEEPTMVLADSADLAGSTLEAEDISVSAVSDTETQLDASTDPDLDAETVDSETSSETPIEYPDFVSELTLTPVESEPALTISESETVSIGTEEIDGSNVESLDTSDVSDTDLAVDDAEEEERPSSIFAQIMYEMKALVQSYGSVPRMIQQVTQRGNMDDDTDTSDDTQLQSPTSTTNESGTTNLDADLDSLNVEPLNLERLTVDDSLTPANDSAQSETVASMNLFSEPVVGSTDWEVAEADLQDEAIAPRPSDEPDLDAIDLYMDSDDLLGQSSEANGLEAESDQNSDQNVFNSDLEGDRTFLHETSTFSYLEPIDTPDEDGVTQSSLDAFLAADDVDDIDTTSDLHDQDPSISAEENYFDDVLNNTRDSEADMGTELSADELARLEEQGLLASLALPDESILEESEEQSDPYSFRDSSEASTFILANDAAVDNAPNTPSSEVPSFGRYSSDGEESAIANVNEDDIDPSEPSTFILDNSIESDSLNPESVESLESFGSDVQEIPAIANFDDSIDERDPSEASTFILDNPVHDVASGTNTDLVPSTDLDGEENGQVGRDAIASSMEASHLNDFSIDDWDSEDDSLSEDVVELEEQELEELLAWDSVTLSQYVSNQFEQAVLSAQEAIRMGETATTADDWLALAHHWQQAADLMRLVPDSDPNFDIAQRCQMLYQSNSEYAHQKGSEGSEV